jgi:hypothetical protein
VAYLKELETLWGKNRLVHHKRRRAMRGPNLVDELQVLFVQTKDKRFADCIDALLEHGIVDAKWNFVKSKTEAKFDENIAYLALIRARSLTAQTGVSLSRACAQAAADIGFPAVSLGAACKQIKLLHAKAPPTPSTIHLTGVMEQVVRIVDLLRQKGFKGLHYECEPLSKMAKKRYRFTRQKKEKPSQ